MTESSEIPRGGFRVTNRRMVVQRAALDDDAVASPIRLQVRDLRHLVAALFRVSGRRVGVARTDTTEGATQNSPSRRRVVLRRPRETWEEFGWTQQGNDYFGEYRVDGRSWSGRIHTPAVLNSGAKFDIYVHRPPDGIAHHRHHLCWHHLGDGWYWVHYNDSPNDIIGGIKDIENTLREALAL